jgi:BirA family transcriptional regulator, biotin operon repressor / biotin---[acetyl-CoA-carboxylase] ligase
MPIGSKVIQLSSVDSTNNYAAMLVSNDNAVHGTVILADEQTAGRGQRGAKWQSESGSNLLMSIILKPDNLSVDRQFLLTQVASLAVVDLLRKIGLSAQIKWPNDIYVGDRKICGMLIENNLSGAVIRSSIIGIGLNVNQSFFDLTTATSIKLEKGQSFPIQEILFSFIGSFNLFYDQLMSSRLQEIEDLYKSNMLGYEQKRIFEDETGEFLGMIRGVDPNGKLRIEVNGVEQTYDLKQLRFIFRNAF